MRSWSWILIVGITVAVAAGLRLPRLSFRPMHTDEAVHAEKMGGVLETGRYEYDPNDYHGPTLNGFTRPIAWLRGQATYQNLDEVTLRLVPALFGIGLVFLPLLFYEGLGRRATFFAIAFTAVSPAFTFYSRYYIQEMLLVFFATAFLGCAWRYLQNPRLLWILLTGVSAGLMHATKETCIMSFGCTAVAVGILVILERPQRLCRFSIYHLIMGGGVGLLVSALWFSWFFTHPRGILDSFATYTMYLSRGAGHATAHVHPWTYYLDILTWIEGVEWPGWNEDYLVVGAVMGMGVAFFRRELPVGNLLLIRFWALYTFLMTVIYSSLSYKTPWCLLGFLQGMIVLAAIATDHVLRAACDLWEKRLVLVFVIFVGLLSPLVQSVLLNFKYDADQTNPYVYAHTHRDIGRICAIIRQYAQLPGPLPSEPPPIVQVVCPGSDYWPLPWYLRDLPYVGYNDSVDFNSPTGDIVVTQPAMEPEVMLWLYDNAEPGQRELYFYLWPAGLQLRHHVELRGYARKSLWDRLPQSTTQEVQP